MKKLVRYCILSVAMSGFSQAFAADKVVVVPLNPAKKIKNVVTVSPKGGDFTDPVAAVDSISDASAANPYLVLIGPGEYMLTRTLEMESHISIAGAGRQATILRGSISSGAPGKSAALVSGSAFATLCDLTIRNDGGGTVSIALYNNASAPVISHVDLASYGSTNNYGVYNVSSPAIMADVWVNAARGSNNYGIYNVDFSSVRMTDVFIVVEGGTTNYGVSNNSSSPVMTDVTARAINGTLNNYGISNSGSSPVMTDVTAIVWGGTANYGVYNNSSHPTMTNVTATNQWVEGGWQNYGVYNSSSNPRMIQVMANVAGAAGYNYGVCNDASSPGMTNVIAIASGGGASYGVFNSSSHPTITQSVMSGATNGLYNADGTTIVIRSSIKGGIHLHSGVISCVNSDDGTATELRSDCTMP